MNNRLFAYGTLLFPSVMEAVTGRSFEFDQAILRGYARYKIKYQVFPGIIQNPNHSVEGIVYNSIDQSSLQRLDEFESEIYNRREVQVNLNNQSIPVYTYVVAPGNSCLLCDQDWDPDRFNKDHLDAYINRIK